MSEELTAAFARLEGRILAELANLGTAVADLRQDIRTQGHQLHTIDQRLSTIETEKRVTQQQNAQRAGRWDRWREWAAYLTTTALAVWSMWNGGGRHGG